METLHSCYYFYSRVRKIIVTQNRGLYEDYNISFTCLLDTVTGGTITFDENITILKGNSTGSTGIKTLNDYEFSALTETGSYVLSATTVSATTTPFNCNFKTNFIYSYSVLLIKDFSFTSKT